MKFLADKYPNNAVCLVSGGGGGPENAKGGRFIGAFGRSEGRLPKTQGFFFLGHLLFFGHNLTIYYTRILQNVYIVINQDHCRCHNRSRRVENIRGRESGIDKKDTPRSLFPRWKTAKPVSRNRYVRSFSVPSVPNVFSDHSIYIQ